VANNCAADGIAGDFGGGSISATVITGGGIGALAPETSVAKTVGLVWTPTFGKNGLSVSLDYFNFFIKDEVATLEASSIVSGCYNSDFFPNEPLCNQFFRNELDQRIDTVSASFLNINSQENIGYDLGINYDMDLDFAMLRLESRSTYQEKDEVGLFEGTVEDNNGDIGEPKLTSTFSAAIIMDGWTYNWKMNYVGKASNVREDGGNIVTYRGTVYNVINTVDAYHTHTFSVAHTFSENFDVVVGVANAFDEAPPFLSYQPNSLAQSNLTGGGNAAFFSQYDFIGRRFFANVTYNF
jgi:iron complex outermembrane receptor protein